MIVICVYKSGGDFTAEHVSALRAGLDRYMPCSFSFWCLTDRPFEVMDVADKVIQLGHDLPGWWSKIELFRPIYDVGQTVIYFDLDVMVLKPLDDFINVVTTSGPTMLRSADSIGKANDWPSSSIMSWRGNELMEIYTRFFEIGNVIELSQSNPSYAGQRTDQGFIRTIVNPKKFQDYLPPHYILYKVEYLSNPILFESASILNWTGRPRFQNMNSGFKHIKKIWKNLNKQEQINQ
jgi:hypothetical protein